MRASALDFLRGNDRSWDIVFLDPPFDSTVARTEPRCTARTVHTCTRNRSCMWNRASIDPPQLDSWTVVKIHPHRRRSVATGAARRLRWRSIFRYHRALPRGDGNLEDSDLSGDLQSDHERTHGPRESGAESVRSGRFSRSERRRKRPDRISCSTASGCANASLPRSENASKWSASTDCWSTTRTPWAHVSSCAACARWPTSSTNFRWRK